MNKQIRFRWITTTSLALLLIMSAIISSQYAGVIHAQDPLELDAKGEIIGDDGYGVGQLSFQYPSAWEFIWDDDGYLATRAGLVDDFDFGDEDLLLVFADFTYQDYDYSYEEGTDPVEYIQAIIDGDIADGLSPLSSEALTIGSLNAIHQVYEAEGLEAHVFGLYEDGNQPIVAYTVGLAGAYPLHEATILAILETVQFDPDYDPNLVALNNFVATVDVSNAQDLPAEGERQAFALTADDDYVVFAYTAEADTVTYFRLNEVTAADDQTNPAMLILDADGNQVGNTGSTSTSIVDANGDPVFATYSDFAVSFAETGTYYLIVGVNGSFIGAADPAALDLEIYYQPVMVVSGNETIEVPHVSGQEHIFVTEEIFDQEMTITAVTADNTGLKLDIYAGYLADATSDLSSSSFQIQDPDSTLPMAVTPYYDPEYSEPGRLVFKVTEEFLPHEGELIPDVETTLTITIAPAE